MKVTVNEANSPKFINVSEMPHGSLGIDKDGQVFFRTYSTATCLAKPDSTYPEVDSPGIKHDVRLLPKGSIVTLVVE